MNPSAPRLMPTLPREPVELPAEIEIDQGMAILKSLFVSNPMAVIITDSELDEPGPRIMFANRTFLSQSGYEFEEIEGRTPRIFQGPRTDRAVLNQLRADLTAGRVFQGETTIYRKDATPFFIHWSIVPILHRGKTVRYLSFQLPISGAPTPFYPMASLSFSTTDPFEAVFDTAEIGIAIIDRSTKFVRVNDAICRFLGYQAAELVGRSFLEFCDDPNEVSETRQAIEGVFEGILELNTDYRMRRVDGDLIVLRSDCKVLRSIDENRYLVWAVTDVTSKRVLEERLRQSELRLDLAIHGCGLGFWDYDCQTGEVYFSPGWKRMLGFADHELPNEPSAWESRIHADDFERVHAQLSAFLAGQQGEYRLEYRLRHRDGSDRLIDARGAAIRDELGQAVRFMGTHTDVTDRSRLEAQLRQTHKLEAIGQLAGGIAHDFNNLLTVILGNLDMIRLRDGDPNRTFIHAASTAATRAAELTGKLLGYARRSSLTKADIAPGDLLHDVAAILKPTLDPRIAIRIDAANELPTVRGDAHLLLQTVLNLAVNARDAMPNGGNLRLAAEFVPLATEVDGVPPGDFIRISVTDTGIGMDATTLTRLFEPFFSTKSPGRSTGMGLAVAYGTVRQHGGRIAVESELGKGSRFDLFLPVPRKEVPKVVPVTKTVLIVDDEDVVRSLAGHSLKMAGWKVLEAEGIAAALDHLTDEAVDLILLDMNMPGEAGEAGFRTLRNRAPGTKIILISGGLFEEDWHRHADGSLRKPFDRNMLLKEVSNLFPK